MFQNKNERYIKGRELAFRLVGVGFFISSSIVLGILAGLWLDAKLNTEPLMMLLGVFAGLAIAIIGVYRMLLPLLAHDKDKRNGK